MATEETATTITITRRSNGMIAASTATSRALWCFPVDFGDYTYVCVSWEEGGDVYVGLVDPTSIPVSGQWTVNSSTNVTAAMSTYTSVSRNVADHWHIFACGFHIITVSVNASELYLLMVDPNTFWVAKELAVLTTDNSSGDFFDELPLDAVTNDHHCFAVDDTSLVGVAVGSPAGGGGGAITAQHVYVVDIDTEVVTGDYEFGDPTYPFANLSSAVKVDTTHAASLDALGLFTSSTGDEWQVLATGLQDSTGANALYLLATDNLQTKTYAASLPRTSRAGVAQNLAMGTQLLFANGWRLVMFRNRLASAAASGSANDNGDIFFWLLDENLAFVSGYSEAAPAKVGVASGLANRPHAARVTLRGNDYLLVGFDKGAGAFLWVYTISYA